MHNTEKEKLTFYEQFIEVVEDKGNQFGGREAPFLTEVLTYILAYFTESDEPTIISPPYRKTSEGIQLNGYLYEEEENRLNLYVVEYEPFGEQDLEIRETTMTSLKSIANMAKRFYTNAEQILKTSEKATEFYDVAQLIINNKNTLEEINIYVVTSKFYSSNKPIDMSIKGIQSVNVHIWDMDRIFKLSEATQGIKEFKIDFEHDYNESLNMLKVPNINEELNVTDCYIGMIPALTLAKIYDDLGPRLVERNVRSFLQARGGTNKGIRDTLKDPEQKELFVSYNNGISSVAKDGEIELDDNRVAIVKNLTNWQIVNGGQTTASIHQAYKSDVDLEGIYVQAKLTILNINKENPTDDEYILEDQMISKISEYANTQNKINKSDLLANTRFMSDLEKFSRSVWIPMEDHRKVESKWYFERARGQYMVDIGRRPKGKKQNDFKREYPKEHVITKVEIAKYFMSWEGYPHISSKGGEEAFKKFMDANSEYWKISSDNDGEKVQMKHISETFYKEIIARRIINGYVSDIVNTLGLKGYKANVNYYTVAMLNHLYSEKIDLLEVWNHQRLSDKWENVVKTIAKQALTYLRGSAGEQNVTQWAKKEDCWIKFKKDHSKILSNLI